MKARRRQSSRTAVAVTRRGFLGTAGGFVAGAAAAPYLAGPGIARPAGGRDVFIHLFLRGGMDGLTMCVPHGDDDLYAARPNLAIPKPGQPNGAIDLDGFFGLAPACAPLVAPYQNGHLAIVHATGSTDPTRSHFDAMQHMELGIPEQPLGHWTTGWLGRHLQTTASLGSPLRGAAVDHLLPQTLAGAPETIPIPNPAYFDLGGLYHTIPERRSALLDMHVGKPPPLGPAAVSTFETIDLLKTIDFENYVPQNGAQYPETYFGEQVLHTAALVKGLPELETVMLNLGDWDTHDQQGPQNGWMAYNLDELSRALEAFYLDTLDEVDRYVFVVASEFGRRVEENGSLGTDHGHGNCMLVMGGAVQGGQVLTQWPGLDPTQLDEGDLAITIDYRDILAEILERRLDNTDLAYAFPNYTPTFRGIVG